MKCPKCKSVSGDDWSRCKGSCPIKFSPYYDSNIYRKLLYHPESDCYWEVFSEKEYLEDLQEGYTEDVTGVERHEKEFENLKY